MNDNDNKVLMQVQTYHRPADLLFMKLMENMEMTVQEVDDQLSKKNEEPPKTAFEQLLKVNEILAKHGRNTDDVLQDLGDQDYKDLLVVLEMLKKVEREMVDTGLLNDDI